MNWYIGQPIVCIKSRKDGKVKRGEEFNIKGLSSGYCKCTGVLIDVGLNNDLGFVCCGECGIRNIPSAVIWSSEELFAPLDVDISELENILSKENLFQE